MAESLREYLKDNRHKEGSFILCNMAGFEWQMLKDGEVFSNFPEDNKEEAVNMIAINNDDKQEDNDLLKRKAVAILTEKVHCSFESINLLAEKAGYKDFNIDIDYIIKHLKFPFEDMEKI